MEAAAVCFRDERGLLLPGASRLKSVQARRRFLAELLPEKMPASSARSAARVGERFGSLVRDVKPQALSNAAAPTDNSQLSLPAMNHLPLCGKRKESGF